MIELLLLNRPLRRESNLAIPPFGYMTSIILSGSSKSLIEKYASNLVQNSKKDKQY